MMIQPLNFRVVIGVVACTATLACAGDWPQWRGPQRDGHTTSDAPSINSLPKELKPIWKLPIGPGFSSPIVTGSRVIYLDEQNGREVVHAVESANGKELWQTPMAQSAGDEWGTGPRSTPFVDGSRVYAQSMNGEFLCLNLADGKILWRVAFKDYGVVFVGSKAGEGTASRRGNSGSGVIHGDYVYVPVGAKGASIVCFDKLQGKEVWKSGDDEAAYSSFLVATLAGVNQLVAFTADALTGLDLQTGRELWRVPFKTNAKRHAASPVVIGPDAVTVNSHTFGLAATTISREGAQFQFAPRWSNKQLTINLSTPVLVDGHLYSQGGGGSKALVCADAASGAVKWSQPGFGKDTKDFSALIAVGKNLLVLTYDGQLILLAANPDNYTELGRAQVCGNTWCHPALADGKLYVRDGRELQCFDLNAKTLPP